MGVRVCVCVCVCMCGGGQASRDSIAPVVKENFGDLVDKLRTIEGREATFGK